MEESSTVEPAIDLQYSLRHLWEQNFVKHLMPQQCNVATSSKWPFLIRPIPSPKNWLKWILRGMIMEKREYCSNQPKYMNLLIVNINIFENSKSPKNPNERYLQSLWNILSVEKQKEWWRKKFHSFDLRASYICLRKLCNHQSFK